MKGLFSVLMIVVASSCLSGCYEEAAQLVTPKQPTVYLGAGIRLQVDESETAAVTGNAKCPDSSSLDCIKLVPNGDAAVNVRIFFDNGSIVTEQWVVAYESQGYSLTRPNGFKVRAATNGSGN